MKSIKLLPTLALALLLTDCTCVNKCADKHEECQQRIIDKLHDCYVDAATEFNESTEEESVKQAIFDTAIALCDQDHANTKAQDEAACKAEYDRCVTKCANEEPQPPLVPIPDPGETPPLV